MGQTAATFIPINSFKCLLLCTAFKDYNILSFCIKWENNKQYNNALLWHLVPDSYISYYNNYIHVYMYSWVTILLVSYLQVSVCHPLLQHHFVWQMSQRYLDHQEHGHSLHHLVLWNPILYKYSDIWIHFIMNVYELNTLITSWFT